MVSTGARPTVIGCSHHSDDTTLRERHLPIRPRIHSCAILTVDRGEIFVSARESYRPTSIDAMPPDPPTSPPASEPAQILDRVMALSHEAIVTTRLDGIVISWSRGAERMYGFPADEMTGQSIHATVPAEWSTELGSILDRVGTGGAVEDLATVRCTKNGDLLDVRLNVMPIQDDTGRVASALMVARDVTWQRHTALLESEGRWQAPHRVSRRRDDRHRRAGRDRGLQPGRRAPVRLFGR